MTSLKKTVVVGMSGGVDSSVTALLLKQQGYQVIGMFMKNWEEKDEEGVCKASKEFEDVVRVCEQIGIPYYSVNFVKEYWDNVFSEFLHEFKMGHTPNPDILCNREIKFKVLLDKALQFGADFLATGHYCNTDGNALLKAADLSKDQSYFLYTLKKEILQKVLFPIGHLKKSEVRAIAREHGLATSHKKDSTGICFIGKRNFKQFLSGYLGAIPGDFKTLSGKVMGKHDGVSYYTIGQRKGMGIGGAGDAWFVVGKDVEKNVVYIEQGSMHPALYVDSLIASNLSFVSDFDKALPFSCRSKIRYRQEDQPCRIEKIENSKCLVTFEIPQRAATLRQSIVFYEGDTCLGGGIIESIGQTYHERDLALPEAVSL
ncbi:MAG TPA: tRNA 2-thiouridine(34) synthase MnmA [Parachlamydiaceae bacterium]|nr:tRNA 2-thiouridine(34) synthase MnmA [Parachlamydiaceae bacterium]